MCIKRYDVQDLFFNIHIKYDDFLLELNVPRSCKVILNTKQRMASIGRFATITCTNSRCLVLIESLATLAI